MRPKGEICREGARWIRATSDIDASSSTAACSRELACLRVPRYFDAAGDKGTLYAQNIAVDNIEYPA